MINKEYKRFYLISLVVLTVLSAYPLINGIRMAYLSIANGAIEPEQYAKYVVPYAAMCFAVILFASAQPLLFKIKRSAFTVGLTGAYTVFVAIEQFFENIKVNTGSMTLVDPSSFPAGSATTIPSASIDVWQASLCMTSPLTMGQSMLFSSHNRYFYVLANNTYKIHYYIITLILITMICGLIYGIGSMKYSGDNRRKKTLILQCIATSALISLCVFANMTAFFRQPEAIQTPLASVLTCLFFIVLGSSAGIYSGSLLLNKGRLLGIGLPVLLSVLAAVLMYIGEAAMMKGGLYRFGTGWFFEGLPNISMAPADILVVLLSGAATWLVLHLVRKHENQPSKQTMITIIVLCILTAGIGITLPQPQYISSEEDILGCYEFDQCTFMNPLSSTLAARGFMPYVYGLDKDMLIIANTGTGHIQQLPAKYENTPVSADEFSLTTKFDSFPLPEISHYKDRRLRAVFTGEYNKRYALYQMDGEIWLAEFRDVGVWSIYRLKRTDISIEELKRSSDLSE